VTLVVVFILRFYLTEPAIVRFYGANFTAMDTGTARTFTNHHIAGLIKLVLLTTASYPFIDVAFVSGRLNTPSLPGSSVRMGDVMLVCSQLFIAMYVFELFYRVKICPISAAHHIGAIVIARSAVAIGLNFEHEVDATIEFVLCFVWGTGILQCTSKALMR